ncbi:MAG: hypothetical protein IJT08_02905 [Alphaproteobacteria bacterium]|nr:hypothetical protein [Alphaproteobacteria bacterium]
MNKWFFVVGILFCSLLFFVSGTFVGYRTATSVPSTSASQKPLRRPSEDPAPLIGTVPVDEYSLYQPQTKVRRPSWDFERK